MKHRGNAESVVPAINLRQQTAQDRSGHCADVDTGGEDDEAARPSRFVLRRIERADLRRDIALEKTGADDQQQQGEQE